MQELDEVAPGVHRAAGMGNWHLVVEDGRAMAVDAGLPADAARLDAALERLGRPELVAVLLTHGHADHIGFAEHVRRTRGTEVLAPAGEVALLVKPLTGVRPERSPLAYVRNGSARAGAWQLLRGRAHATRRIETWTPVEDGAVLGHLPCRPVVHATPGHTPGHAAIELPDLGIVFTGDALVTLDPYTGATGPRLMARGSTWDAAAARRSLERLESLDAELALPGHGDPWRGSLAEAAAAALRAPQG